MENSCISFKLSSLPAVFALRHDYGCAVDGIVLHRQQRFVGLVEWKHSDSRLHPDLRGQFEKVASVAAGHVGHTAQLALAPEQTVVIELRDAIKMNRVDRHHAAFAQADLALRSPRRHWARR